VVDARDEVPRPSAGAAARTGRAATIDALRAAIAAVPPGGSGHGAAGVPGDAPDDAAAGRSDAAAAGAAPDDPAEGGRDRARRGGRRGRAHDGSPRASRGARPDRASSAGLDVEEGAREYLLRSLTASARSRKQLADGLAARDVPADVAARVLDRFTEVGLVDDPALARAIVRSRSQETGAARRRIADELRRKGIDPDVAADALAQIDDEDERRTALDLARARARRLAGLERDVALRRLVGVLARKGYPPHVCLDAARAGLESLGTPSGPGAA